MGGICVWIKPVDGYAIPTRTTKARIQSQGSHGTSFQTTYVLRLLLVAPLSDATIVKVISLALHKRSIERFPIFYGRSHRMP